MAERVQVKVFFLFPCVGSPDGRESQLAPEVPTAGSPGVRREFRRRSVCAESVSRLLYNRPRPIFLLRFLFLSRRRRRLGFSSCRPIAPSPPTTALPRAPASFLLPPPPEVLPVVPTDLPPFHHLCPRFLRIVVVLSLVWRRFHWWRRFYWWRRLCPWICSSTTAIRFFSSLPFLFQGTTMVF